MPIWYTKHSKERMKTVYVVLVDGKPHVYSNKAQLLKELEATKTPFEPTIHECEIQKRGYSKREVKRVDSIGIVLESLAKK